VDAVHQVDAASLAKAHKLSVPVGVLAGVFGSFVGVGGGVLIVPLLTGACKALPQRCAGIKLADCAFFATSACNARPTLTALLVHQEILHIIHLSKSPRLSCTAFSIAAMQCYCDQLMVWTCQSETHKENRVHADNQWCRRTLASQSGHLFLSNSSFACPMSLYNFLL